VNTDSAVIQENSAGQEWVAAVEDLVSQIREWATAEGWQVTRLEPKTLWEPSTGTYSVSDLRVRTNSGVLNVDVVAREICRAEGRVELVAFPSLERFTLIRRGGKWRVRTDWGNAWPKRWGRRTFVELARKLTSLQ
jgi:hypothetical protein